MRQLFNCARPLAGTSFSLDNHLSYPFLRDWYIANPVIIVIILLKNSYRIEYKKNTMHRQLEFKPITPVLPLIQNLQQSKTI